MAVPISRKFVMTAINEKVLSVDSRAANLPADATAASPAATVAALFATRAAVFAAVAVVLATVAAVSAVLAGGRRGGSGSRVEEGASEVQGRVSSSSLAHADEHTGNRVEIARQCRDSAGRGGAGAGGGRCFVDVQGPRGRKLSDCPADCGRERGVLVPNHLTLPA
jgi:hypothetical protein